MRDRKSLLLSSWLTSNETEAERACSTCSSEPAVTPVQMSTDSVQAGVREVRSRVEERERDL